MKKLKLIIIIFFVYVINCQFVYADSYSKAEGLIKKAANASIKEEGYEYINSARLIYQDKYNENESDIKALLGLSKTYQLTGNRQEAKIYVLKAYNIKPYDSNLQKEMGDFYYNFQEYSTAVEYYKLALASGLLRDFETNYITAKCFEKLGDNENAELYYQICNHLNPKSKKVAKKINAIESSKYEQKREQQEDLKYTHIYKDKQLSEEEQTLNETDDIINKLNGGL